MSVHFPLVDIRKNINDSWNLVEITETITVPIDSPYINRLKEVPDNGENAFKPVIIGLNLVNSYLPNNNEYSIKYSTGDIIFNENQAGNSYVISYYGKGSLIEADDINYLYYRSLQLSGNITNILNDITEINDQLDFQNDIQFLSGQIEALENIDLDYQNDIQFLSGQINDNTIAIGNNSDSISNLYSDDQFLSGQIDTNTISIQNNTTDINWLSGQINTLENIDLDYQNDIQFLSGQINDNLTLIENNTNSISNNVSDIQFLSGQIDENTNNISSLNFNINHLSGQLIEDGTLSGQLLFWNGDDWIYTNDLYWDDINKKMGVNTNTPNSELQVNGNLTTNNLAINGTTTYNTDLTIWQSSDTSGLKLRGYDDKDIYSFSMYLNSAGNGVIAPSSGRSIFFIGNSYFTGDMGLYDNAEIRMGTATADRAEILWDDSNNRLLFKYRDSAVTDSSERMSIYGNNSNVVIHNNLIVENKLGVNIDNPYFSIETSGGAGYFDILNMVDDERSFTHKKYVDDLVENNSQNINWLSGQINILENIDLDYQNDINFLSGQINYNTILIGNNITDIQTNLNSIKNNSQNVNWLSGQINDNTIAIGNNSDSISNLYSNDQFLSGQIDENTILIGNNSQNINWLSGQINILSSIDLDYQNDINFLSGKIDDNLSLIHTNTNGILNNVDDLNWLSGQINDNTIAIGNNSDSISNLYSNDQFLSGQIDTNTIRIQNNAIEISNNTSVIQFLSGQVDDNTSSLSENITNTLNNTNDINFLSGKIDDNSNGISNTTNDIDWLSGQFDNLYALSLSGINNTENGTLSGQFLFWNETKWTPTDDLTWDNKNTYFGINTNKPNSNLNVNGSFSTNIRVLRGENEYILDDDFTLLLNGNFNTVTAYLPSAIGIMGRIYNIKCVNDTYNTHFQTIHNQTVDRSEDPFALCQDEVVTIQSDGYNWEII